MMNNNYDDLVKKIKELENENLKLKHRIEDLEKDLELSGKMTELDEPLTLNNYYFKKYLAIHDEVYKLRFNKLDERENNLQNEYTSFLDQEQSISIITSKNEEINNQIKDIENQISNKFYELEKMKFEFSSDVKKVTNEENKLTNDTLSVLSRITSLLTLSNNQTVINEIKYTMTLLENSFYPINLKIAKTKYNLVLTLDELTSLEQRTSMETKALETSKKQLLQKIQMVSIESVETILDSIKNELEKITKSKTELKQLFDMLKDQNLKKIQDEIRHFQILEYTKKDIAFEMDKIIEQYYQELLNIDTISNMQLKMIVELSKLTNELSELEDIKKQYEIIKQDYEHLNSLLVTVNNNISQMEQYVKMTSKAISSKPEYNELVNRYEGYLTTIILLKQEIENTKKKIVELKEERRLKSLDPFAKATIQKLLEQIKSQEGLLEKYNLDLENTNKEIEKIESSEKNLKLMNVLKDKKIVESKLPNLYNQQKELVTTVSMKQEEVKNLEAKLIDYDNIIQRIEELKGEISN